MNDGPDAFAHIVASGHAVDRARERLGWRDEAEAAARIRAEVRIGILAGRVADRKPNWVREPHRRGVATEGHYVWDADGTRCWAVKESGARARTLVVTTLLVALDGVDHEAKKIRAGMVRR